MSKDEKIAYLMDVAQVAFCQDCDKPIHLADWNTVYYTDNQGNYQCVNCASKSPLGK